MSDKEYIIFCDESDIKGKYFSNFYGGLIVGSSQYERITARLNSLKTQLNLYGEIKWNKVTELYLQKYIKVIEAFFEEVIQGNIKIRIMFHQNAHIPMGLSFEQADDEYFLLYYQFLKHAFGLSSVPYNPAGTRIRIYLDKLPDTAEKIARFKGYLLGLQENSKIKSANVLIHKEDITEIRSHDHVLAQCLDIVLGSIQFRLNDKHKEIPAGQKRRGKRTKAKESLYKVILKEVRKIHKNFNIGVSTSLKGDPFGSWNSPYQHWRFVPESSSYEQGLTKRGKNKNPT
jgi:hypothetical protein